MSDRTIPRVLHQTWKDEALPRAFSKLRKTWLEHHPDWEHRLWTDSDNRALLRDHYPWFLPVYDGYPENIMRVDAARYFILHRFGGVYADLDLECLRPIDSLLEGKQAVIGREPPGHVAECKATERGHFDRILCNAFMASVPGHPFWEHVMRALPVCHDNPDPLGATGPFFLTRTFDACADRRDVSIESHELLYPVGKHVFGARRFILPPRKPPESAYTVHRWAGSWWSHAYSPKSIARGVMNRIRLVAAAIRNPVMPWLIRIYVLARPDEAFRYVLSLGTKLSSRVASASRFEEPGQRWVGRMSGGEWVARSLVDLSSARALLERAGYPLVSCLMVTRERYELARRAVECFRGQAYPNLELVIVDHGANDELARWVGSLGDSRIRCSRPADRNVTLGELRNLAVQTARGEYIAQWDDDDISHPDRVMEQMTALFAARADAVFVHRLTLWQPGRRRLGVSERRVIEGTMVARKDRLGEYPALGKGEDTPLCRRLLKEADVAFCDRPELYVYVFHGANTWGGKHVERIWKNAAVRYRAHEYDRALAGLQESLATTLDERAPVTAGLAERLVPARQPAESEAPPETPQVLVLVPVKNGITHLERFAQNLDASSYPRDKLSLAFLESDSEDGSFEELGRMLPGLRERYARVELFKRDFGYRAARRHWAVSEQFTRRSILARSRNLLLFSALRDEQWVLWIDVELLRWPADTIERLLAAGEDVVVPHCVRPDGSAFDLDTFVLGEDAGRLDWSRYTCDGILQPPVGYGRRYLGEFGDRERVALDGVGGTMLLVRADAHRQGLVFPAYGYAGCIETGGLAKMAQDMGYRPYGLPGLVIVHE